MVSEELPNLNSILKNSSVSSNKDSLSKETKMSKTTTNKILFQKRSKALERNAKPNLNRNNIGSNHPEKSSFNTNKFKGSKNNSLIHSFRG